MEVRQTHGFSGQPVDVRRLDVLVIVSAHIAVALVVGHDENDVGTPVRLSIRSRREADLCNNGGGDQGKRRGEAVIHDDRVRKLIRAEAGTLLPPLPDPVIL